MITIKDKGGSYGIDVYAVPPFPQHLEDKLAIARAGGYTDEAAEFLRWWVEACTVRGFKAITPSSEPWVHARWMLARYPMDELKKLAVEYFIEMADEKWLGPKVLRMFRFYVGGEHGR